MNPLKEWSDRRTGRYLNNTQQTQKTNTCSTGGILKHDHGRQAATNWRLRQHGSAAHLLKNHILLYFLVQLKT
jgi:hypothetical protein